MKNEVNFDIKIKVDGKAEITASAKSVAELGQTVDVAKSAALRFSDSMQRMASKVVVFRGMADASRQIADTLNAVTEESRSFETAMRAANTMAGKNSEDFSKLKGEVAELAKTVPIARDALASGLYQVISNGVPEDNWIGFLEKSVKASVGGIADLGQVVNVTSTIIKNYGLEWDAAADIQDKIQMTAKNGVTSFEQLAAALPRVTANASTLGVSIDELMATFATLTGVSGNTAEVSTQLAAIFTALVKPSSEATEMARQMGIQFDAAAIKAAGGMQNFLVSLNQSIQSYAASSGMLEAEIQGKLFGSAESLRALIPLVGNLSEKYSENVQAMAQSTGSIESSYENMANTVEAKLQMLKNKWGEVTDFVQSAVGSLLPALNFGASLGMTLTSTMTLASALQGVGVGAKIAAISTRTLTAAQGIWRTVALGASAATTALTAAMRGAAVGATTLKVAIRGLMAATGVGIAIAALTWALEKLVFSSDEAADGLDGVSDASQRLQQQVDAEKSAYSNARVEMDKEIQKLGELIKSKGNTAGAVQELNNKYSEAFGYHKTASEWYKTLTENSETYCRQLGLEAKMKVLAAQGADIDFDLEKNKRDRLAFLAENNGKVTIKNKDQYQKFDSREEELLKEKEKNEKDLAIARDMMKKNGASIKTSPTAPTTPTGGKVTPTPPTTPTGGKVTPAPPTTPTPTEKPAEEGSYDFYENRLKELREQIRTTGNEALASELQSDYAALEQEFKDFKIRVGIEKPDAEDIQEMAERLEPEITLREAKRQDYDTFSQQASRIQQDYEIGIIGQSEALAEIAELNLALEKLGLNPVEIPVMTEDIDKAKKKFEGATDAVGQMGQSLAGLGSALELPELNIAGTIAQAIATMAQGYAQASAQASALGPWGWIAFAATGLAQLTAMIASVKQATAFAQGGIVSGPTMALVGEYAGASNNPEVIAPLDKLRSMIGPQEGINGRVVFKIEGRTLRGVLEREQHHLARS